MRLSTLGERRRLYLTARLIVKRHYAQPLTLALLAKTLATSPRQLQRAYTQFGEQGFREDLLSRRMAAATELLSQTTLPVHQIARRVGYPRARYFGQVFHDCHGVSPTVYRTQAKRHSVPAAFRRVGEPPPPSPQEERTQPCHRLTQ